MRRTLTVLASLAAALLLALSPFDIQFAPTAFTDPLMVALAWAACLAALRGRHLTAGLAAILNHRRAQVQTAAVSAWSARFIYPALGLIPVWCVYLMRWLLPAARHEHYGLMLLVFAPLGLVAGRRLERQDLFGH